MLKEADTLRVIVDVAPVTIPRLAGVALQYGLSAYDASYLELALRLNLPLASTDGALRDAARKRGYC
jgi:predicted nucleic acid-binding protein